MKHLSPLIKAVQYIEEHLYEGIGLKDVSDETGYSYYHMTRLFSSALGESVGHYINRRRLTNAAEALIHSDRRIIDIAIDSGFGSAEAFSRAFKSVFGSSPLEYRKAGLSLVLNAKKQLLPEDVTHITNNISHTPFIVELEETRIAGIWGTTSLFENQLPQLWGQFIQQYKSLYDSSDIGYCICETQQTTYAKDGDVSFSVMVGIPADEPDHLPHPLIPKTLSAGKYAVFIHRGTLANLPKTYQYIFGTWLLTAKEELDEREDFEVYEHKILSLDHPDNEVKIYIPLK